MTPKPNRINPPGKSPRKSIMPSTRPAERGFTLIELMITASIIAILAGIAFPSYLQHAVKTRRTVAKGCLMEQAQAMERYHTTRMSYANAPLANTSCVADLAKSYTFRFAAGQPTAETYEIVAVARGAQASGDSDCTRLSMTETGVKSPAACWN